MGLHRVGAALGNIGQPNADVVVGTVDRSSELSAGPTQTALSSDTYGAMTCTLLLHTALLITRFIWDIWQSAEYTIRINEAIVATATGSGAVTFWPDKASLYAAGHYTLQLHPGVARRFYHRSGVSSYSSSLFNMGAWQEAPANSCPVRIHGYPADHAVLADSVVNGKHW